MKQENQESKIHWIAPVQLALLLFLGVREMSTRLEGDVTAADLAIIVVFFVAIIGSLVLTVQLWLRRGHNAPPRDTPQIPVSDIEAAIAGASDRVSAVRALRERHPELGLAAATNLVDERRPKS